MASRPPRLIGALFRGLVRLQPDTHRQRYGADQILLFEEIWINERPASPPARIMFALGLLMRGLRALVGLHREARRSATLPGWPAPSRGGSSLGTDVRFTLRALRHAPWYSATVIGVVAVTLALATTVFAVVDGVLFRRLPYPDAGRLVIVEPGFRGVPRPAPVNGEVPPYTASALDITNWRAAAPDVGFTGFRVQPWAGVGTGINDDVAGVGLVQANFFDVVGVRPLIGGFEPDDFAATPVIRPVILMYEVWQARFQRAPDIVGRVINADATTGFGLRVRGVMPKGFSFPSVRWTTAVLMPMVIDVKAAQDPASRNMTEVLARLAPGTTSDLLPQRLAPGIAATAAAFPPRGPKPEGWSENSWRREGPYDSVNVTPLGHWLGLRQRGLFSAVFAAVVLLVLIAAANVSSLMTSRAAERRREMDMRVALGAGPGAITRLWTLEAATLVTAGGVLGVIAATPTLQLVLALLPESTVLLKPAALDWRVAGFVAITVLVLSMLVSATPVSRSLRALAGVAKGGGSDRARTGARVVISGQVAAAFVLTVVGACLVGSLLAVYGNDRPIRTADLLVVEGRITGGPGRGMGRSPERPARAEPIVERLRRIGGVSGVTLVEAQLLRGGGWDAPFRRPEGRTSVRDADCWAITAGFYDVVGLRAIEGRLHTDAELRSNAPFIVVSERIARAYWPGASPIGEVLTTHDKQAFSVIGVVPEVPWFAWDLESPMFYGPYASLARSGLLTFFIRTSGRTGPIIAEALRTIADADRQVRLNKAAPLSTLFRDSISLRRFQSWLFGGFAAAALAVVGVGILGLLAMSAARRTREIGIRCALGATPSLVTRQLVREQLIPVVVGLAIGGAVAAWAVGFVERYLYKLTVTDPRIWSAAIALILATALLGALLPARRASRIDPVKALRVE